MIRSAMSPSRIGSSSGIQMPLMVDDGLIDNDDVVVVAARFAYPEYLARGLYICQPQRAFRDGLTHMAFYANGAIQVHVPRIRYRKDQVTFTHDEVGARQSGSETDRLIGAAIEGDLHAGTREESKQYQVFLLSAPDDPDTVRLPHLGMITSSGPTVIIRVGPTPTGLVTS